MYQKPIIQAMKAGADLSTHQYKLVKFGASADLCVLAGNDEEAIGVLMNAPKAGEVAEVAIGGGALVKIASTVALGASVGSGASGVGKTAAATRAAIGKAMDAGVTGDVIPVFIDRHFMPA